MKINSHRLLVILAAALISDQIHQAVFSQTADQARTEQVIYTTLSPRGWDVLLFDSSSDTVSPLAPHPALDYDPTFSPDGRWLVFTSERRGNPDLWALDLTDDSAPVLLTPGDSMQDAAAFSPDGQSIAFVDTRDGNAEIYIMPFRPEDAESAFLQARNVTRSPRGDFRPAFSPNGNRIAFCSDRGVPFRSSYPDPESARDRGLPEEAPWPVGGDIFVMEANGSNPVRLTEADGWDGSPAWSRDGRTIYFYTERTDLPRIWRMNSDGSEQRPLFSDGPPGLSPTVGQDGRVFFFTPALIRGEPDLNSWRIFSVAADGTDLRPEGPADRDCRGVESRPGTDDLVFYGRSPSENNRENLRAATLLRSPGQRHRVELPDRHLDVQALHWHFPAVSIDGSEIMSSVLVSNNETEGTRIIVSPIDGREGREVYRPENKSFQLGLSWSGDWVVFGAGEAFAQEGAPVDIWKVREDGTEAVNLTSDSNANDAWPDYSAEAGRIVFRSGRDGNFEIYLVNENGGELRRLTDHPERDTMPAISTDGDYVVFSSTRDGEYLFDFDLYLLVLDEGGAPGKLRRLTNATGPDMHVRFSPDGEWIVYTSQRGGFNDEFYLSFTEAGQTYGEIFAQRLSDGMVVRLTHNKWEDGAVAWGTSSKSIPIR